MYKKTVKQARKILALAFACAMLFGSANVLAEENTAEVQETAEQEKAAALSLDSEGCTFHNEVGKSGTMWGARLINTGTEDIDLSQYDLRVRGTEGADGVEFALVPITDPILRAMDEFGNDGVKSLDFTYTIPADCKAPVIKLVVDIFEKGNAAAPLYTTAESKIYPYTISEGILNYNDTTRPSEYELKVETNTGIHFDEIYGPIYSDGQWTEIREEGQPVRWFLKPGYPQAFQVTIDENYAPAVAELMPSDAGTVTRVQGMPGMFRVDLHAPATLKVSSGKIDTQNWMNTIENYVRYMQWIDMMSQTTLEDHFFEETAPANDVAVVTYYRGNYNAYVDETGKVAIPYAVFAKDAEKFFQNIPDLKTVNVKGIISYDTAKDAFVRPAGGAGDHPYITDVVRVEECGKNTYAIRFKLSKKTLGEGLPDMNDPEQYTECTLAVEDNGEGQWRYLAFVKGWNFIPDLTEEPVNPGNPEDPEPDTSLVNPDKNEEFSTEFTNKVTEAIEKAENGSEVIVGMNGATEVPAVVLKTLKGKDVDVVLDMGNYTWTINGKDVTAEELKSIDLGVVLNADVIPEEVVNTVAKGKESIQISIAHDGEFGFKADLSFYVGKEHSGKTVKLYYYNKNGKLEFVQETTAAADGTVVYTFEHASDYVAVIDEKSNISNENNVPKTGDPASVTRYVSLLVFAAVVLGVLLRKKVNNWI